MRLKARRKRSKYRSDLEYIRSVFQSNKNKIIENISIEWLGKRFEDSSISNEVLRRAKGIEEAEKSLALYNKNPKKLTLEEKILWKENKKEIQKKAYQAFKNLIEDQMKYTDPKTDKGYTVERAILREARSKDLNKTWDSGDVFSRNFHELILREKDIKEVFYQHEGIKRIDYNEYKFLGYYYYDGREAAVYNYGDSYFLEFQSPKEGTGASLIYLSGYQWQRYKEENRIYLKVDRKRKY